MHNSDHNVFAEDVPEKAVLMQRGLYPLSVRFLNWQQSNVGDYIEFKIRVSFQEG